MKVLDVIKEGRFSWLGTAGERLIAKEVVDAIATKWAEAIVAFKQTNGKMPTFNDIIIKHPPDAMTVEKALANNPQIQKEAWEQAVKKVEGKFSTKGLEALDKAISKAGLKLAGLAGWLAWFVKWGVRFAMVYELGTAWRTYEEQVKLALDDLNSGVINGAQFKTLHDRILIQFYASAGPVVAAAGIGGLARAGLKGKDILTAFKNGRFIRDILVVNPADKLFSNLSKTIAPAGVIALSQFLDTDWGRQQMVYYLTAEGMQEGNVKQDPTWSGTLIEKILADTESFKQKALDAAKKGGSADKIPPSVQPKPKPDAVAPNTPSGVAPNTPATAQSPAANDDDEEEKPVSGGIPQRPSQGAQQSGTSSLWK